MFGCATSTLPVPLRSAPMIDASILSFLGCFSFIWHFTLPFLVSKFVTITLPLQVARMILIAKPTTEISTSTVPSITSSYSIPFPTLIFSGMTCYVLQVTGQRLWNVLDDFSIATHYSFQPQEGGISAHRIFENSAPYIVEPGS